MSLDEIIAVAPSAPQHIRSGFLRAQASSRGQSLWEVRGAVLAAQVAADFAAITTSILVARAISLQLLMAGSVEWQVAMQTHRVVTWLIMAVALCGWFAVTGHYTVRRPLYEDAKRIAGTLTVIMVLHLYMVIATQNQAIRYWIMLVWPVAMVAIPVARVLVRRIMDKIGWWRLGVLVIGSGEHSRKIDSLLSRDRYVGYVKTGHSFFIPELRQPNNTVAEDLKAEMERSCAKLVIVAPSEDEVRDFGLVADVLNQNLIPYYLVPPIQKLPMHGLSVRTMFSSDAVFLSCRSGLMSPSRQLVKRAFDIAVSATLLILLAPLFLVLAIIISADGGAPVYGHRRIGRNGQAFHCLKFRSMQRNADRLLADLLENNPAIARQWYTNFKLDPDPRITPIGRILRKTSLDELPQLFNVLRGEMSLVGPRPVVADELERYYGKDVFYYTLVRPGMTGLWQISGRSTTTYERRVFLDSWYVRNWTLWTDLVIFFNTVPSVLSRDGAV